ncbi:MFS transporter [Pseudomonas sp. NBRC 111134]|uniref:MFS transporter n=1 Tax=Pseudomonas sp. NBRC 111134 TaxID=1661049 RepID=UPI000A628334
MPTRPIRLQTCLEPMLIERIFNEGGNVESSLKEAHRHQAPALEHPNDTHIRRGTPQFMRTCLALLAGGFSSFALLYCVQPMMPAISIAFEVDATQSSLILSISTIFLALGLFFTGPLSDSWGRKNVMVIALFAASLLTLASAATTKWEYLLAMRAGVGLALSGITAVAITYLSEEIDARNIGFALGIYIGGSAIGGMAGRLISGMMVDYVSWHWVIAAMGAVVFAAAVMFWKFLPESKHFKASTTSGLRIFTGFIPHLKNLNLIYIYIAGFLLMGSLVTFFNYIGYHLLGAPFNLSQTIVSLFSLVYMTGTYSSAKIGGMADRHGHAKVLKGIILVALIGVLLTLVDSLPITVLGTLLFTFGFFGSHATASSWIGRFATSGKAQATSLYQITFYCGASVAGTAGGEFWSALHWHGVALFISAMLTVCWIISYALAIKTASEARPLSN